MKKLIATTCICLGLIGCQTGVNDQLIINGASVATSTGLSLIKDANVRTTVRNCLQGYAPGLRTISNNPTAAQIAAMIDQYTPASVKTEYPQVIAFATPLITNAVLTALETYGHSNADVVKIVNDVATGLEIGSAGN